MGGGKLRQRGHIHAMRPARHGQQPDAHARETRKLDRPARAVHQHRIARAEQRTRDHIQCMGGAAGGNDLRGGGADAQRFQVQGQHVAQQRIALGRAIQRATGGVVLRHGAPQGLDQQAFVQPVGRQHAGSGRRAASLHGTLHLVAHTGGKHGADQAADIVGKGVQLVFRSRWVCLGRRCSPFPHKEAPVTLGAHQTLRQQLVVGSNHGMRTDAIAARALPHRGQARACGQQSGVDTAGE